MRENETPVRDGRDAGEAPLLLLRGGEAQLREARDRALPDLLEPRGRPGGAVARERLEVGEVTVRDAHATAASVRSQSYPFSSMSSPESVSSRIASLGSSTASCRISLRFFSPPENPSFTGRVR